MPRGFRISQIGSRDTFHAVSSDPTDAVDRLADGLRERQNCARAYNVGGTCSTVSPIVDCSPRRSPVPTSRSRRHRGLYAQLRKERETSSLLLPALRLTYWADREVRMF
jgi:hypothetical protein